MNKSVSLESLQSTLAKRGGVLKGGKHSLADGACCALELVCAVRQCDPPEDLSDDPNKVDMPDIRPLNDAPWSSDALRTEHMLPVIAAYAGWSEWTKEKRSDAMKRVALENIRQTLPLLLSKLGFEKEAKACSEATDLKSAEYTAEYAAEYAKSAAEYATKYAKSAAEYATKSAKYAAEYAKYAKYAALKDQILIITCKIWVEAVK